MKRTGILTALVIFSMGLAAYGQDFKNTLPRAIPLSPPAPSLKIGETLEYSVEWLGMPVGNIILKVVEITAVNNHPCYHIIARSYPNRFIRKLYDVEYKVHTYLDTQSLVSRRFIKIRRINRRFNCLIINFFPEKNTAMYRAWGTSEFINFAKRPAVMVIAPTFTIPKGTQDLLSSFFCFRLMKIAPGEVYKMNLYYSRQNWPINISVARSFLKQMRKKGTLATIEAQITSDLNEYILGKRKFFVDLTADSRRIPLEFKVGTAMGLIRGVIKYLPE